MKVKMLKDGRMKIHMNDVDDYELTDDNGVDVWFSKEQVETIKKAIETFAKVNCIRCLKVKMS